LPFEKKLVETLRPPLLRLKPQFIGIKTKTEHQSPIES